MFPPDDILVPGTDFDAAIKGLEVVFDRYFGHIVSSDGLAKYPDKVKLYRISPDLTASMMFGVFLGLCSYYRHFIDRFDDLAARSMFQCTKGGAREFTWSPTAKRFL